MSHRIEQINALIRQQLNEILIKEFDLPKNCLVTITRVETVKNLTHSKIFISVLPFIYTKKIVDKLNQASGFIQSLLYKKLFIKPLPKIHFSADITEQKANEIETLLDNIKNGD